MNFSNIQELSQAQQNKVLIFTVSGCGEFGMNITILTFQGKSYVIDCGLAFAAEYEIGIDAHIPSPEHLYTLLGHIPEAFIITHGHEDHIGALPYFLCHWNIPVYAGPWALELLKEKLRQRGDIHGYDLHEVLPGTRLRFGDDFYIDWVPVPHSIPDASSLLVSAGRLRIFHSGDFKSKGFRLIESDLSFDSIKHMVQDQKVDILLSDSTNAFKSGYCPSESETFEPLKKKIAAAPSATYITTFSSNVWRIKIVLLAAQELKKRVFVFGASMKKSLEIGTRLKYFGEELRVIIDEDQIKNTNRSDLIVLCPGCQGEYRSALSRIVNGEIGRLSIEPNDHVIFSSRVIPGNEKSVANLISKISFRGAIAVNSTGDDFIHVSGHAYADDLHDLITSVNPEFYLPIHGTFTHLMRNGQLFFDPTKVLQAANGRIFALESGRVQVVADIPVEKLYIDSWSRQPMPFETMRARHKIGDSGLAVISGYISSKNSSLDIEFIGIPFQSSTDKETFAASMVRSIIRAHDGSKPHDQVTQATFNELVRTLVRRALTERFIKKPVVMSKISLSDEV